MFSDMLQRYALVSHLLLACSIGHISTTVTGFYDIITHFLSNKTCVAILYNYCLMLFIFCCKIPVMIFIGQLTRLETEELIESLRSYLTDSILFLVLSKPKHLGKELLVSDLIRSLAILLAVKAFHILLSNRLSHMFEMDIPSFGRALRVSSFIYVLSLVNVFLINFFIRNLTKKNTFTIWVIFELLGMMQSLFFSTIKFIVNLIDIYQQNGLVNKVTLLFYIELLQDMASLVTFTTFMILFFVNNPINIPIYMIIDIIHVAKNLNNRIKMLIEYRKLSKVLNSRFPVYEPLNPGETCIICRDVLDDTSRKIDCGHAFHLNCLKSWLFQHSSCPSCRTPIYSSSVTQSPLLDLNSFLYSLEQRVLIAIRKVFKWADTLADGIVNLLVKTWPFNKVFKKKNKLKNKLCKVVLILSNRINKQDSYDCFFINDNQTMEQMFQFLTLEEFENMDLHLHDPSLPYETSSNDSNSDSPRTNRARETIIDTTSNMQVGNGQSNNASYNSFVNNNTIGSITAAIELNINAVNVIKRYRFNQLFFITPNSTSKTNRINHPIPLNRAYGPHSKEKTIFEGLLEFLNEKDEETNEDNLKELKDNLMAMLPLLLASMGTMLGSFTQAALLSVLRTSDEAKVGESSTDATSDNSGSHPDNGAIFDILTTNITTLNSNPSTSDATNLEGASSNIEEVADSPATDASTNITPNDAVPTSTADHIDTTPAPDNLNTDSPNDLNAAESATDTSAESSADPSDAASDNEDAQEGDISTDRNFTDLDEHLIKREHVKFLIGAKNYSLLMLKLNKKRTLNITDLLVNLQMIQMVVKNHL